MSSIHRYKRPVKTMSTPIKPLPRVKNDNSEDAIWLQLSRIAVVTMLTVIGFLVTHSLQTIERSIDDLAISLNDVRYTQERVSVMTARIDESVRHLSARLERGENRIEKLEQKKR